MNQSSAFQKHKLVIWGASGHALVVADIIRLCGTYEIVGFLDDKNPERSGVDFGGSIILGGKEQLDLLQQKGVTNILMGFGDCAARLQLADFVRVKGFNLAVAIHPRATIAADVTVGAGTVVAAGAVVNPGVSIGENVIINTSSSIDHECIIEDGVHICPGTHLGGRVIVGRSTWVGIGTTLIDRVHIGRESLIGAGSVVIGDIPDGVVAYGVPAKIIRRINDKNQSG